MNLRDAARGRPCQVRLPGICNNNPETTVLAHIRIAGTSGTGYKPADLCATWCCSACHDVIDKRVRTDLCPDFVKACAMEGVLRTLSYMSTCGEFSARQGKLSWKPFMGAR